MQRVEQQPDTFSPLADEIDCHRIPDTFYLSTWLKAQRDDEPGIAELLRHLQRDIQIVLNMGIGESGVAANQENFCRAVLQSLVDLPAPPIAWLKRQDVREHAISLSLEFGREPKREFVVNRRRLDQKDGVSGCFLDCGFPIDGR